MHTRTVMGGVAAIVCVGALACGGNGSPTGPGPSGPGPVGATITITSNGMAPGSASINAGQSITLVNNDTRAHQISSNPHPSHTDCAQLNLGTLNPGQSRTSDAFPSARTCGYHDHNDPNNGLWMGTLTVR